MKLPWEGSLSATERDCSPATHGWSQSKYALTPSRRQDGTLETSMRKLLEHLHRGTVLESVAILACNGQRGDSSTDLQSMVEGTFFIVTLGEVHIMAWRSVNVW